MNIVGEYIDGINFPVCNTFKPQILDGELCYVLDFKDIKSRSKVESHPGRGNGLLLAIDTGINIGPQVEQDTSAEKKGFIRTMLTSSRGKARLHILTSHRHEVSRPGIYTLKNLKYMTGTDNFLAMPDEARKCQIQSKEECRTQRFVQEVQRNCGCIPWTLSSHASDQVNFFMATYDISESNQLLFS